MKIKNCPINGTGKSNAINDLPCANESKSMTLVATAQSASITMKIKVSDYE